MRGKFSRGYPIGVLLGVLTVIACASTFPWPYYATKMPDSCYDQGSLLGKQGSWPDLPLADCKPDPQPSPSTSSAPTMLKCITVKIDDFYSIKADDEKCHSDLKMCQAGKPPSE